MRTIKGKHIYLILIQYSEKVWITLHTDYVTVQKIWESKWDPTIQLVKCYYALKQIIFKDSISKNCAQNGKFWLLTKVRV